MLSVCLSQQHVQKYHVNLACAGHLHAHLQTAFHVACTVYVYAVRLRRMEIWLLTYLPDTP
jgi:hypothetical protein